jgi:hypothetical protein
MTDHPIRWEFYKDRHGQWQWRKFRNEKVVAVSSDGFTTRDECLSDAKRRGYIPEERPE